ncbi:S1C family serine protease [Roseomonas sp. HF4]|uniref:S1C family serine protease n=1 Tax=Roseomonas sp. HF4 TaxID=2562313 RepID=UPI0010C00F8B|nr:serine protease [Roseomonas sp. HF4]
MRFALPFLLLLLPACAEEVEPPVAAPAAVPDGTLVTDYGGGPAPVARYLRLPDGRAVRVEDAPAPPAEPADPVARGPEVEEAAPPPAARRRGGRAIGTGTAFAVTQAGLAVTNAHVVSGCSQVVDEQGRAVRVVAADRVRDLALIDTGRPFASVVRFRPQAAVDLGETVLVFGYPYGQALGTGLNVTNGIVTGLAGPGGDSSRFQMNAAVQPGNSGGPAVDDAGQLLGVAVGRLNDIAVLRATGSLPQGINFAIRAAEVERFLAAQGVAPARGRTGAGTGARAVSAAVAPAVFQILCRG